MLSPLIPRDLCRKVLMVGVCYKHNAPGGMAAVVQYYARYMAGLRYVPSWRLSNAAVKLGYGLCAYVRILLTLLFDRRVRIVHLHTAERGSFYRKCAYMRLSHALGRKAIIHMHSSMFKDLYGGASTRGKARIVANLRRADKLVVLSESWKEWFEGIGVDSEKIVVLHNITDFPRPRKPQGQTYEGRLRLLFLGVIGERKGVFDLLRALAAHKGELQGKVHLRIGGNTHERELLAAISEQGLEGMVTFEGWVSGEQKTELLHWADVYILPSYNEGLPIAILEAMSYGCPIISTPVGGIPEVVIHGTNGRLVTPGNEEEIYQAINHYIEHPQAIGQEGRRGREIVTTYLPDYVMTRLEEIYKALL